MEGSKRKERKRKKNHTVYIVLHMYILYLYEFLYIYVLGINKQVALVVSFIPNCIIDESKPLGKNHFDILDFYCEDGD